jgi:hypothetical protein
MMDWLTIHWVYAEAEERPDDEEEYEDEENDTLISRLFEELEAMRQRVRCSSAYNVQGDHATVASFSNNISGLMQKSDAQSRRPRLANRSCKKWRSV